jgi:hypothetical protein
MEFRLIYEGEVAPRSKINVQDVHAIRTALDPQLKNLWQFEPLSSEADRWLKPPEDGLHEVRGATTFAPLVSKRNHLHCELDIVFLRKQPPGQLIGEGGDIDNRLKTLLDALCVPPFSQQEIFRDVPSTEPIYCLLQDDSLVTKLSVETDRLLRPTSNEYDLVVVIQVRVTASRLTLGNVSVVG